MELRQGSLQCDVQERIVGGRGVRVISIGDKGRSTSSLTCDVKKEEAVGTSSV